MLDRILHKVQPHLLKPFIEPSVKSVQQPFPFYTPVADASARATNVGVYGGKVATVKAVLLGDFQTGSLSVREIHTVCAPARSLSPA